MKKINLLLVSILFIAACGSGEQDVPINELPVEETVNEKLEKIIAVNQLTGDPSSGRDIPNIDSPLAKLGKKLFFSKSLGGDTDAACASCHHPLLGGGDALSLSVGTGAEIPDLIGPGRKHSSVAPGFDGGPTVPRNSPTTFNIALWDESLFWDGRVESLGKTSGTNGNDGTGITTPDVPFGTVDVNAGDDLVQAQAGFPITSPEEMKGFEFAVEQDNDTVRAHLAARLGDFGVGEGELINNLWLKEFQTAYNSLQDAEQLITIERITQAISAYERSQLFINNSWKAYLEGDTRALSEPAKRGALLFYTNIEEGGAGCSECHSGDKFTDEQFHNLCTIQIGRGKGNGETGDDDFGRFNITGEQQDKYAFRTPSLLNVEVTGPWGHSGAYTTLESIVRHHLNPRESLDNFDYAALEPGIQTDNAIANTNNALAQLESMSTQEGVVNTQADLSDDQVNDIIEFLKTLTDPCTNDEACLAPWLPDESTDDLDSTLLRSMVRL